MVSDVDDSNIDETYTPGPARDRGQEMSSENSDMESEMNPLPDHSPTTSQDINNERSVDDEIEQRVNKRRLNYYNRMKGRAYNSVKKEN